MADYRKMYTVLFNDVTEAIALLKGAQVKSEEIFVSVDDGVFVEDQKKRRRTIQDSIYY